MMWKFIKKNNSLILKGHKKEEKETEEEGYKIVEKMTQTDTIKRKIKVTTK